MGFSEKLAVVGLGHLGQALVGGLIRSGGIEARQLTGWDIDADRLAAFCRETGIEKGAGPADSVKEAGCVIVAVKPADVRRVMEEISASIVADAKVVSTAAGLRIETIRSWLGDKGRLARIMPNIPVSVGEGALALSLEGGFPAAEADKLKGMLSGLGLVVELDETLLDTVTGLSASGPAFVALLIETMAEAGVSAGLAWDDSLGLTVQTFLGTARLLKDRGQHPSAFRRQVTTPGGTTVAGLRELESGAVRSSLMAAVEAAVRRSRELARTTA